MSCGADNSSEVPVNLENRISSFLKTKRKAVDMQNQEEFIETVKGQELPARLSTKVIIKEGHIRSSVVDNQDGPLSRSVISSTSGKLVSPHGSTTLSDISERPTFNGFEERVRNVETHLGIVVVPTDKTLAERVKVLEDKILKIEQSYPQIASHVFNYGRAEAEASSRPGGRVSKLPGTTPSLAPGKKKIKEDILLEEEALVDDSSLGELKRRMSDLKTRLLKQAK